MYKIPIEDDMMKASTFIAIMHDTCYTKQENTHPSKKKQENTHSYISDKIYLLELCTVQITEQTLHDDTTAAR